jgi:crotonobetainyl-CoA:carnitine CoA-transferase CaiB-like acyl-CoA transferase
MTAEVTEAPLEGIRIVDLTHFVAGPWATVMLADLGADVVKVEPPEGEIARRVGTVFASGESAVYLAFNRNKRAITCDLKTEAGRGVLDQLLAEADVAIHNFRPGVAERLGIGHARLSEAHPSLIHCSISAFGVTGPRAQNPANDPIVQGISGAMLANSDTPVRLGVPVPDFAGAIHAAIAVVAALWERTKTGRGGAVEINLLDSQMYAQLDLFDPSLAARSTSGNGDRGSDRHGPFECRDGRYLWLEEGDEPALARIREASIQLDISSAASGPERRDGEIGDLFHQHARDEWVAWLNDAGVRCVAVRTIGEAVDSANGVGEMSHPSVSGLRTLGLPMTGLGRPPGTSHPSPRLGEHTDEVLAALGANPGIGDPR